jgi:uncharacterized glyoxalase superfamily protein PhnB
MRVPAPFDNSEATLKSIFRGNHFRVLGIALDPCMSNTKSNPPSSVAQHYGTFKIIPFFRSTNITDTVAFYQDILHFTLGGVHSNSDTPNAESEPEPEPTFASLFIGAKADANIYFLTTVPAGRAMIGMSLEGLESYYSRLKEAGTFTEMDATEQGSAVRMGMGAIENKPWGYRQFDLMDKDGNELTFFAFLSDGE